MKIELIKYIELKQVEMIAEVDFFNKQSPYLELLKDYHDRDHLRSGLLRRGIEKAAVANILRNLEALGVMDSAGEIQVSNAMPEREYGKYAVSYFDNGEDSYPFNYYISGVERLKAVSENRVDRIEKVPNALKGDFVQAHTDLKDDKKFEILSIKNDHILPSGCEKKKLKIIYEQGRWKYHLFNKRFDFPEDVDLLISNLLNDWSEDEAVQEVDFDDIYHDLNIVEKFVIKEKKVHLRIPDYGDFDAMFRNIPVIPNEDSYYPWFIHLFHTQVCKHAHYMTVDEIEQMGINLYHTTPQLYDFYNIPMENNDLIEPFIDQADISYWHVRAAKDLNPFNDIQKKIKQQVVFQEQKDVNMRSLFDQLGMAEASSLIILDRYINTTYHAQSLTAILKHYPNIQVNIVTMQAYRIDEKEELESILSEYGIHRVLKDKKDIPHDRYWIIDHEICWVCTKSIDFIDVFNDEVGVKHAIFSQLDRSNMELMAQNIIEVLEEHVQ